MDEEIQEIKVEVEEPCFPSLENPLIFYSSLFYEPCKYEFVLNFLSFNFLKIKNTKNNILISGAQEKK